MEILAKYGGGKNDQKIDEKWCTTTTEVVQAVADRNVKQRYNEDVKRTCGQMEAQGCPRFDRFDFYKSNYNEVSIRSIYNYNLQLDAESPQDIDLY